MTSWDDGFMLDKGARDGLRVDCCRCPWFWGFHAGQSLSDVVAAARAHKCPAKLVVNSALDALDMIRLRAVE